MKQEQKRGGDNHGKKYNLLTKADRIEDISKVGFRKIEQNEMKYYARAAFWHDIALVDVLPNIPIVENNAAIIIDESSMMDTFMLNAIMGLGLKSAIRVYFVGDKDQLPSVQVGNVLSDMIGSDIIPTYVLTDIMRQSADSHIIKYCADINAGEMLPAEQIDVLIDELSDIGDYYGQYKDFTYNGDKKGYVYQGGSLGSAVGGMVGGDLIVKLRGGRLAAVLQEGEIDMDFLGVGITGSAAMGMVYTMGGQSVTLPKV